MQSSAIDLRPTTWDEVIGQDSIVSAIQTKLKSGVPPAWLFIGPSGSGKTTLSEILARAVQGEVDEESVPFLDIRRINAADKNGVDDMRGYAEEAKFHPTYGKYRVIILDEAHMLTPAAQNTLLIPTELSDSPTIWIFCTTDPNKLLPTLRSRCVTFELKPFGEKEIITLISSIGGIVLEEQRTFTDEVVKKGLTNPREILYAWDKYAAGMPLEEAISSLPESNPVYTDIAKYAIKGNWDKTRFLLQGIQTADVKGMKSVLSWFFRKELLNCSARTSVNYADALSESLIRLGNLNAFEDGVIYSAITGILYHHARKVNNGTK